MRYINWLAPGRGGLWYLVKLFSLLKQMLALLGHNELIGFWLVEIYMMTSSNGNIFRITGHFSHRIHRSPVYSPHKGQWRGALMFSLICVWINSWVNNCEAGDLRCYRVDYDVIAMIIMFYILASNYSAISHSTWIIWIVTIWNK